MAGKGVRGEQFEFTADQEVYNGNLASAKQCYGDAIDAYLSEQRYDAAIRTCRKLIRLAPDVVRTHFTLAYLLVGQRRYEGAAEAVSEYEAAVRSSGAESYARPLLTLLAYVTEDEGVRARIRRILSSIGPLGAEVTPATFEATLCEVSGTASAIQERWERLLPIALGLGGAPHFSNA